MKTRKIVRFHSREHGDSCIVCGCKDKKHIGNGQCSTCYAKAKAIKIAPVEVPSEDTAKPDYRLHQIRRGRGFEPIKTGDRVDMNEIQYLVKPKKYMSEEDLDEQFPKRYLMTEEQLEEIGSIPDNEWEDICSMDGKCCYGYGTARKAKECCRLRFDGGQGCSIYHERPEDFRCPDIRTFFAEGTFHYLAHRECNYWDKYEEITGCKFTNRK